MTGPVDLPDLGVGLGYRPELHEQILANKDDIDWLEIITDHYLKDPGESADLLALREAFTIVPHGLELSVGSDGEIDQDYLEAVAGVADAVDAPWVSDHLCFTRAGDFELANLTPVVRTLERAKAVAMNSQRVQDRLGRPFLLENITYYLDLPGELTEAEFITEVMEQCDCGLLLDLNNLALNAHNHGFDAQKFLDSIPLERVVQVHLAGNSPEMVCEGLMLDGHDAPVGEEVFDLLAVLAQRQALKGALIERDERFSGTFDELSADLSRARAILA